MRAYIHIGMDKTGTTYLQDFCYHHRKQLHDAGLCYPLGSAQNVISQVDFAHAFGFGWAGDADDSTSAAAMERLGDVDHSIPLLLSSESFALDDRIEFIHRLKRWTDANGYDDIRIIVFVRNQVDFFAGIYSEAIKWGNKMEMAEFYKVCRSRLSYSRLLANWAEVFGYANIIVRNYDSSKDDLGRTFFSAMGMADAMEPHLKNYVAAFPNISPPQILIEYIRSIKFPMDRSELYDFIVTTFASHKPRTLRSLAKRNIWPLPDQLIAEAPALDAENLRLAESYHIDPFPLLETRIAQYTAKLTTFDHAELNTLATILLADMRR